jgi:hypothetical protein
MTAIAQRLRNLRAHWSESRARKRERDASAAHAQAHRDPNPPLTRRHGEDHKRGASGGGGG